MWGSVEGEERKASGVAGSPLLVASEKASSCVIGSVRDAYLAHFGCPEMIGKLSAVSQVR